MIFYEIQNVYEEHIKKDDLTKFMERWYIEEYYFILHDKDTFVDILDNQEKQKKPHYHIIVGTNEDSRTAKKTLQNVFSTISEKVRINNVKNLTKFMRYLTHKDNQEKHQYNDNEVMTNNLELYSESISLPLHKITDTDKLLNQFIGYVTEKVDKEGTALSYLDMLKWFQQQNAVSYFVQHYKAIEEISRQLFMLQIGICTSAMNECNFEDLKEILK